MREDLIMLISGRESTVLRSCKTRGTFNYDLTPVSCVEDNNNSKSESKAEIGGNHGYMY